MVPKDLRLMVFCTLPKAQNFQVVAILEIDGCHIVAYPIFMHYCHFIFKRQIFFRWPKFSDGWYIRVGLALEDLFLSDEEAA
jgi:hypothetical protein